MKLGFSQQFLENIEISDLTKILHVGTELFHADG
jgi:hypothetical protein